MSYIGSKPANKPVVASDLDPTVITGQTALATSPASTDEFLISDAGVLKRLDASLIGGTNTPAFFAYLGSNQDISDDTWTKVSINTEEYDTAGNFDNSSNYRFTPTTAGKYFFYATVCLKSGSDNKIRSCGMAFYKNGSALYGGTNDVGNEQSTSEQTTISASFTMNGSSDYVELYGRIDVASGIGQFLSNYQSANRTTYFGAYKILT